MPRRIPNSISEFPIVCSRTGGTRTLTELGKSQPCCHNTSVPYFSAAVCCFTLLYSFVVSSQIVCVVGWSIGAEGIEPSTCCL